MLTNRPEFHFADTAAIHLGATPFSIYNTSTPEQIGFLLEDAGNRILFTEQAMLDTVLAARDAASSAVETIVVVDGDAGDGRITTLAELEQMGGEEFDFEAAWRAVQPDDLLTLIYTSGTTGPPKGVELTHANLLATMGTFDELLRLPADGRLVSWLPMAHIAERNCTQYLPMTHGLTTTCCPDPRQVVAYLVEVRPTWFFAVPRIWEKLKAAMEIAFDAEPDVARKEAVVWALEVGMKKVRAEQAVGIAPPELALEYAKADEEVLSDLRARIGLDKARGGERRSSSHSATGDRVLPCDRCRALRAVGALGDQRRRNHQPSRQGQDRHRRAGGTGNRAEAGRGRRGAAPRRHGDGRLPKRP